MCVHSFVTKSVNYLDMSIDLEFPFRNFFHNKVPQFAEAVTMKICIHEYVLINLTIIFYTQLRYKGGPVIPRKMISVGVRQELVVEVYPLCLKLIDAGDKSESTIRISKKVNLILCISWRFNKLYLNRWCLNLFVHVEFFLIPDW